MGLGQRVMLLFTTIIFMWAYQRVLGRSSIKCS